MSLRLVATITALAVVVATPPRPANAELPAMVRAEGANLVLNGAGARTKYFMQMYEAGLYLSRPSKDPKAIVAANSPMAIRLEITSGFVSQEKLVESLNEGFHNSTGGKPEPLRREIDEFRRCFASEIAKGDVFDIVYTPARGTVVIKNGKQQGAVKGLAFKQALFGIWLSDAPADKELKRAMLAARGHGGTAR
jgi:hypothetical protein